MTDDPTPTWICVTCAHRITTTNPASSRTASLRVTCQRCGADRFVPVACCHFPGGDQVCVEPSGHKGPHDHGHGKGNR